MKHSRRLLWWNRESLRQTLSPNACPSAVIGGGPFLCYDAHIHAHTFSGKEHPSGFPKKGKVFKQFFAEVSKGPQIIVLKKCNNIVIISRVHTARRSPGNKAFFCKLGCMHQAKCCLDGNFAVTIMLLGHKMCLLDGLLSPFPCWCQKGGKGVEGPSFLLGRGHQTGKVRESPSSSSFLLLLLLPPPPLPPQ